MKREGFSGQSRSPAANQAIGDGDGGRGFSGYNTRVESGVGSGHFESRTGFGFQVGSCWVGPVRAI